MPKNNQEETVMLVGENDFLPELETVEKTTDEGFEPLLMDQVDDKASVIGEYNSMDKLKKEVDEADKGTPPAPDPNPNSEGKADPAPVTDEPEEDLTDEEDKTDYITKATTELEQELKFLGIKPEQVIDRENFMFVQDQFDFIKDEIAADTELADFHSRLALADGDLIYDKLESMYGDLEDEDELLERTKKYLNEDGSVNEKGKRLVDARRAEFQGKIQQRITALKVQSREYASKQHKFYKELEQELKTLNPKQVTFKVGDAQIDVSAEVKLTAAEKRQVKAFMETEYLQVAEGAVLPDGKSKAKAVTENSFWLNTKVRDSWLERTLAAAYAKGRSDEFAKNVK